MIKLLLCLWAIGHVRSAVLPNFLLQNVVSRHEALANPSAYSDFDNTETYGYVDRYPATDSAYNPQFVFGMPRRYVDNAGRNSYPSYDNGFNNFAIPQLSGLNRKRTLLYPAYDMWQDDNQDQDDSVNYFNYAPRPSQQDVDRFEKYIERFYEPNTWPAYDDGSSSSNTNTGSVVSDVPEPEEEDETVQLHSLLNQYPKSVSGVQKKADPNGASSSGGSTTPAPKNPTTVVPATPSPKNVQGGQKEEALLRPPVTPRRPVKIAPISSEPQNSESKAKPSIFDTIKRLIDMHDQLQVSLSANQPLLGIN